MATAGTKAKRTSRALSRERIVAAAIALLDRGGEGGLTFSALSKRLSTGPGAIYWHVASKRELLVAACDAVFARALDALERPDDARARIRAFALGIFDAIDAHPWIEGQLREAPWQSSMIRIVERLGQDVRALGVPDERLRTSVSTVFAYIFGVGAVHASNRRLARERKIDRSAFLDSVAEAWSALDPRDYPFVRGIARDMGAHDDRADFLAGIDVVLAGVTAPHDGDEPSCDSRSRKR